MTRALSTNFHMILIGLCLFMPVLAGAQAADSNMNDRLLAAADRGDLKGVKAAIAAGADVNAANHDNETALELAGMRGRLYDIVPSYKAAVVRLGIIKLLLDHNAILPTPAKIETSHDQIPLNILRDSLYFRQYDLAETLLQDGAPPEGFNLFSIMRSYPSSRRPDTQRRKLFEQALSAADQKTRTEAFQTAVESDDAVYFVRRLAESGADLNKRNWNGFTPLHVAIVQKKKDVVQFLLGHGADPDIPVQRLKTAYASMDDKYDGMTPLRLAQQIRNEPIIVLLKKAGAKE